MCKKLLKFGLTLAIIITYFSVCMSSNDFEDDAELKKSNNPSQLDVRAVYINCEPDEQLETDSESTRFERQEQFKHNALHGCKKKVAITVKMSSNSDQITTDEYIPIDHVFEGPNKKRVRLLNPYVLRLRREVPLQAYKLRRINTVIGVLTNSRIIKQNRISRAAATDLRNDMALSLSDSFVLEHDADGRQSYSVRVEGPDLMQLALPVDPNSIQNPKDCGLRLLDNVTASPLVVAPRMPPSPSLSADSHFQAPAIAVSVLKQGNDPSKHFIAVRETCPQNNASGETQSQIINEDEQANLYDSTKSRDREIRNSMDDLAHMESSERTYEFGHKSNENIKPSNRQRSSLSKTRHSLKNKLKKFSNRDSKTYEDRGFENSSRYIFNKNLNQLRYESKDLEEGEYSYDYDTNLDMSTEKSFAIYEITNPNVMYNVHVQLLEKTSTPDGNSVWNDLTKGQPASVNAIKAEWANQEMSLRYKPSEWVTREEFTLPTSSNLCLVVPLAEGDARADNDTDSESLNSSVNDEYLIVPVEDLVGINDDLSKLKRDNESSVSNNPPNTADEDNRPRVEIRVERALFGDRGDSFNVTTSGSDSYLIMPYNKPYHAQIDLEVGADGNQLVRVGSSGSINTIVADNSRKTRTLLILQASNTGLASARYRAVARDCGPELSRLIREAGVEGVTAGPVLLPPRHTHRLQLELPVTMPVDVAHCSVALLNDDDESVAVRDVAIKKGDRCFCVWHCDCVCLGDDPKLVCREMGSPQQQAAGLPARDRSRQARSVCYCDKLYVNVGVVTVGIILLLLSWGLVKAIVGLCSGRVARLGLEHILKKPRKLQYYYESHLRCRTVVYDKEGWPVHPDSRKRNVQLFGTCTTFVLNCIYFIVLPSIMLRDVIKMCIRDISKTARNTRNSLLDTKKCYSSQDVQSMEWPERSKKRAGLRQWMSPQADHLAAQIWTGVPTGRGQGAGSKSTVMQPLLLDAHAHKSYANSEAPSGGDSDQEDTEYVLMQMQKSRESLAKGHKVTNNDVSSARDLGQEDTTMSKVNKNKR